MVDTVPAHPDPAIFERNLSALREAAPALAEEIACASVALQGRVEPAVARDGCLSFRVRGDDGVVSWFGRTSLPSVRAEALLAQFQAGQANVLLPGIGQGAEVRLLLERLGPHRAVFVWEEGVEQVALALRLHDLAQRIRTGRLILLVCPLSGLTQTLLDCLDARPGHFCPDRIMMWPWDTPAGISQCRLAVEAAYNRIEARRKPLLAQKQAQLRSLVASRRPDRSDPILVMSIHPQEDTWAWTETIAQAAIESGLNPVVSTVRLPGDMHPLARIESCLCKLSTRPQFALLLDVLRNDVADVLDAEVAAISWLTHRTVIDDNLPGRVGPADRLVACDESVANLLRARQLAPARVSVLPLPCLLPAAEPAADWEDRPLEVLLVGDLPVTNAEAYGFDLPTLIKVWDATVQLMKAEIDRLNDTGLPALLSQAERRLRMQVEDEGARARMLAVLAGPVLGALAAQNLVQALKANELAPEIYGEGWPAEARAQSVPSLRGRAELYARCRCVILISSAGTVPADAALAASAGAAICCRAHSRDNQPGGLARFLAPGREYIRFTGKGELISALRTFRSDSLVWRNIVTSARVKTTNELNGRAALAQLQAVATSFSSSGSV